jgi:hypothetical protein
MTIEEKRDVLKNYCASRGACDDQFESVVCPLFELDGECGECVFPTADDEDINNYYEMIFGKDEEEPVIEHDVISHPKHYCREGAMESIDEMVLLFGKEVVKHFCLCNVWKYRYRSNNKNGEEDIKKSDWYVQKYKELCENGR